MMKLFLLYSASAIIAAWSITHLLATRGVVAGFGEITIDNRRIITMEWIVEGVALLSIAAVGFGLWGLGYLIWHGNALVR